MNYFFPLHFDGGNRGCEGIAKGSAKILGLKRDKLIALSRDLKLDDYLGVSDYMTLVQQKQLSIYQRVRRKIESLLTHESKIVEITTKYLYQDFLDLMSENDIMISTGGDMLCYKNNMVNTTNNYLHKKGVRTILWGCSMGKENITEEKYESLKNFSLIYTRDSITYNFFKELGLKNLVCLPDPAFVLNPVETTLPEIFQHGKVIGINVSPFVFKYNKGSVDLKFSREMIGFIEYLLTKTDYKLLFIPHVFWKTQDDRSCLSFLSELFFNWKDRYSILNAQELNYLQIRYIISKCEFFIGARTHAVISAYSTCTPAIALGYSVKSKGIAKDLGMNDALLVDTTDSNSKNSLFESFNYMQRNCDNIRRNLSEIMPEYCQRPYQIKDYL